MLMFTEKDFDVFTIEGLDPRMAEIRSTIQPKFQELDDYFAEKLGAELETEFFVHIAQHRRRTVYPPENTWSALSQKKRGYKMEAHFQLGIWSDYVFMWLSLIDNPKNEKEIAQAFLDNQALFEPLDDDFYLSIDHTQPEIERLNEADLEKHLTRLRDVKKGEFQIGRVIRKTDDLLNDPEKARAYMLKTYEELLPLYRLAIELQQKD
ncbi:hypothetical protein UAY_03104 [Enterococcus moraviensis ATCC BAA-383]|uniref:UPF0637 protein I586_02436 n=1 Tax=Enterococcus moraviensis ATCC BAA-383 TaxID=1158609 RepID=R2QKG2_9ENTE|nr:DUF1054 domain-containing protein [Enterococcus moraviensis]EOH95678.1 hypothetical protein UAY_03104 [Enterococcus moraviensis ATCC BAA-383]EOT66165.1 hypothetical protein I586_02436 [Enterococcus moraviensis ATCC BAA-383]OJG67770.1 hypothetical protein RV09_GL002539 [Enterococcus moraviensis]